MLMLAPHHSLPSCLQSTCCVDSDPDASRLMVFCLVNSVGAAHSFLLAPKGGSKSVAVKHPPQALGGCHLPPSLWSQHSLPMPVLLSNPVPCVWEIQTS